MNRETRKKLFQDVDIYPVTCEALSSGRSNLEVLEGVIQGGAKIIQLREKELPKRDLYHLAKEFRDITRRAGILLMINDHLDIALATDADGVHLGQEDLPVGTARKIAPELLIGASSHSLEEALEAQEAGADYVNIGPIFPTRTKAGVTHFLGPEAIGNIAPHLKIPFTVMGGINASNIELVLKQGARHIAMVTGITQAPDIAAKVAEFKRRIRNFA